MSTEHRSKTLEWAAIGIGALAVIASSYFIFMAEGKTFRLTNWVISLAFLVFVIYNFVNARSLKSEISGLNEKNDALSSDLEATKQSLTQSQAELEGIKAELVNTQSDLSKAQADLKQRDAELSKLRTK